MLVVFRFQSIVSVVLVSGTQLNATNDNPAVQIKSLQQPWRVRVGKGANTEKFYLPNSLLPCKEHQSCSQQEGGLYHTTTGTLKIATVFKTATLSENKLCSLRNILGSNSPQCKARAALLTLLKVAELYRICCGSTCQAGQDAGTRIWKV